MTAEIHQSRCALGIVHFDFTDFNVKHAIVSDFVLFYDAPVHMRQRTFHLQLAAAAAMPDMVFEALFGRELRDASKMLGHILLAGGEHVDEQNAEGLK